MLIDRDKIKRETHPTLSTANNKRLHIFFMWGFGSMFALFLFTATITIHSFPKGPSRPLLLVVIMGLGPGPGPILLKFIFFSSFNINIFLFVLQLQNI